MKSSIRRHHYQRLKKTRKWYWGGPVGTNPSVIYMLTEEERLGKLTRTPHPCSKFCCANRRQFEGPSVNEIRRTPREEDWQDDYESEDMG